MIFPALAFTALFPFSSLRSATVANVSPRQGDASFAARNNLPPGIISLLATRRSSSVSSSGRSAKDNTPRPVTTTKIKLRKTQLRTDLKQYRIQQSAPLNKPPFTVFTNAVIDEIYFTLPTTLEELLQVKGIGPKKLAKFGEDILAIVKPYTNANGEARTVVSTPSPSSSDEPSMWRARPVDIDFQTLTLEQKRAADLILSPEAPNVFVSGSAGTGKSHVLKYIVQKLQRGRRQAKSTSSSGSGTVDGYGKDDDGVIVEEEAVVGVTGRDSFTKVRVGVCAPTGVAAINVGGNTLHSFFGIGLGTGSKSQVVKKVKRDKRALKRINETDTLIIDECSMLSSDLLETLDAVARNVRSEGEFADLPFGGMQVVCFGDFFQLPPISRGPDKPFCFDSPVWAELGLSNNMVELQEVQRQDHRDFVDLLNRIRTGEFDDRHIQQLNARCVISSEHPLPSDGIMPTRLYSLNKNVDAENNDRLLELAGKEVVCVATNNWKEDMPVGTPALVKQKMAESLKQELPDEVKLKVGAQVMLTRNKDLNRNLVNGSRGVVLGFEKSKDGETTIPKVRFDCGVVTSIAPVEAERYNPDGGPGCLARMQVPLKLAWAITVHKSQGTTLTRALLDISSAFEYGQCYVALSRVRSLEGLWLVKPARRFNIKVSPQVLRFYNRR